MHVEGAAPHGPANPLTYRFLIQHEALECLSHTTLVEFLRPFETWCAENGIAPDRIGQPDEAPPEPKAMKKRPGMDEPQRQGVTRRAPPAGAGLDTQRQRGGK